MRVPKATYSTSTVVGKTSVPVSAGYERKIRGMWNEIVHKGIRRRFSSNQAINIPGSNEILSKKDIESILEKRDPNKHTNFGAAIHTAEYYNFHTAVEMQSKFHKKSHREMDADFRKYKKKNRKKSYNKKSLKHEGTKNIDGRTFRARPNNSGPKPNTEG